MIYNIQIMDVIKTNFVALSSYHIPIIHDKGLEFVKQERGIV